MIKNSMNQVVSLPKNGLKFWLYPPVHNGWQDMAEEGWVRIYREYSIT